MTTITLATLPTEVHLSIAKHCRHNDLLNLCLTSKWLNATCLQLLYRHVDLVRDHHLIDSASYHDTTEMLVALRRQCQFVRTLQSRPEYGKFVRFWKGPLLTPNFESSVLREFDSSDAAWRVMTSITHVQSVIVGIRGDDASLLSAPSAQFPSRLFQSATSVTLAGQMQYGLAKAILDSVHPEMLRHLCLDKVQDSKTRGGRYEYPAGATAENGRVIAHGAMSGLLTPLTGRCTALQTLTLRRIGQTRNGFHWHTAAEELSYNEWARFIRSVQGTLVKLVFEQAEKMILLGFRTNVTFYIDALVYRIMDERFQRLVLPTLVSGKWPGLTSMQLQGIRGSKSQSGSVGVAAKLRAVYGGNTTVVVEQLAYNVEDRRERH